MGLGKSHIKCGICNKDIKNFKYAAMPEWNISEFICGDCYSQKLTEHYIKHEDTNKK